MGSGPGPGGIRNFSQQGMFLIGGGTLADRWGGYKPLIIAGCLMRVIGFILLALASSLPAILIASAATGFAGGALFNPRRPRLPGRRRR